jgi:hypothetical protein
MVRSYCKLPNAGAAPGVLPGAPCSDDAPSLMRLAELTRCADCRRELKLIKDILPDCIGIGLVFASCLLLSSWAAVLVFHGSKEGVEFFGDMEVFSIIV